METLETILIILFFITAVLLVIAVLLQANRGGGLQGMLGGSANTNPFGTSATDVMAKITRYLAAVFFLICFGFSWMYYKTPTTAEDVEKSFEAGGFEDDEAQADEKDKAPKKKKKGADKAGKKADQPPAAAPKT